MSVTTSTVTREAGTSQPARRPPKSRLSASHLLIGGVVVLAFVLNMLALQDRSATTLVAVAERPLSAGSGFSSVDINMVPVQADFEGLPSLVTEDMVAGLDGWVLGRSIPAGGLIEVGSLVRPGAGGGLRTMSVPVDADHAAGGTIGAGDRVDVISVRDGEATYVATDIEVIAVADLAKSSLGAIGDYHIVIAVDAGQALALAEAIDSGSLEVIRSTGAPGVELGVGVDEP